MVCNFNSSFDTSDVIGKPLDASCSLRERFKVILGFEKNAPTPALDMEKCAKDAPMTLWMF